MSDNICWVVDLEATLEDASALTQKGHYTLACPACAHSTPIIDWTFLEFDWAFGNLGFGFNNWMIDARLAAELSLALGHRTKVVYAHI